MSSKKKILFVTPNLSVGGTNSSLASIINRPEFENLEMIVMALAHEGNSIESFKNKLLPENKLLSAFYCNFARVRGNWKPFFFIIKIIKNAGSVFANYLENTICKKAVKDLERKYKFDRIIAFQEAYPTKFVSYVNCSEKVAWIHCDYNKYLPFHKTEETLYNLYKNIVCVSEYTATVFRNRYPVLAQKTISIHNLLDEERIKQLSLRAINDEGFNNNVFTIISVGRISSVKRFSLIPQIAKQLLEKGCCFKWYILGPIVITDEWELLKENIKKYEVDETVFWLGNKSNPYPYFVNSNLLVTLSSSEACPMIFNEAKILQLPIVSTDFGSAKEFIDNGKDGIIAPIEEMPKAIYQMINNKEHYQTIKRKVETFESDNNEIIRKLVRVFIDENV